MRVPAPLRSASFRWFFAGRTVSLFGGAMAPVALAFAVLDLTGSVTDLGLVLAARTLPMVAFVLVGGIVADRFSRSTVLVVTHAGAGLTQGAVAVLLLTGSPSIATLVALEAVNGVLTGFTFPALQGVIPLVTPAESLQQANALMSFARSGAAVAGPSVAALLVLTAGSGWAIAADAASFLIAMVCLSRLRLTAALGSRSESMLADLRVGWAEFSSRTWLWVVVAGFGLVNLIHSAVITTLGPAIARDTVGPGGWGLFLSAQAVGLFAASLLLLTVRLTYPLRIGMLGCLFLVPPMLLLGLGPTLVPLVVLGVLAGAGIEVFEIGWQTAMQENVPTASLSRVASYDALGSFVTVPVGQILAGPIALWLGTTQVAVAGGVLAGIVMLAMLGFRSVRDLRRTGVATD